MPQSKDDDKSLLMEQYKLLVDLADRVSERSIATNNTFFSLANTIILTGIGIIATFKNSYSQNGWTLIVVAFAGILFTLSWSNSIRKSRVLSAAKYKVIFDLEQKLPFQAFAGEWNAMRDNASNQLKPYIYLGNLIPIGFIGIYLVLLAFGIGSIFFRNSPSVSLSKIGSSNEYLIVNNYGQDSYDLSEWYIRFNR